MDDSKFLLRAMKEQILREVEAQEGQTSGGLRTIPARARHIQKSASEAWSAGGEPGRSSTMGTDDPTENLSDDHAERGAPMSSLQRPLRRLWELLGAFLLRLYHLLGRLPQRITSAASVAATHAMLVLRFVLQPPELDEQAAPLGGISGLSVPILPAPSERAGGSQALRDPRTGQVKWVRAKPKVSSANYDILAPSKDPSSEPSNNPTDASTIGPSSSSPTDEPVLDRLRGTSPPLLSPVSPTPTRGLRHYAAWVVAIFRRILLVLVAATTTAALYLLAHAAVLMGVSSDATPGDVAYASRVTHVFRCFLQGRELIRPKPFPSLGVALAPPHMVGAGGEGASHPPGGGPTRGTASVGVPGWIYEGTRARGLGCRAAGLGPMGLTWAGCLVPLARPVTSAL
eukprot:jgi/Mesvir1/14715/Mv05366-RA.1